MFTTEGGKRIATGFTASQNGWHFNNDFVNHVIGNILVTRGLCGGMAYSSLDYYFAGLPIPTHRQGDFGDPDATVPPDRSRLHTMIYNRLLDSFRDNFGKWSCVYPELDVVVGAALGIVVGGGIVGGVVGAVGGLIIGGLHEAFQCPRGGPAGMTRQELPNLTRNFLDKGVPVPIGLIAHGGFSHIGDSHQVVAYGYSVIGTTMTINVYDNNHHDTECTLTLDLNNPEPISESTGESWAGLLVEDGYRAQWPSYGPDISIASPQSVQLTGPVVLVPTSISVEPATLAAVDSRPGLGTPGASLAQISMVPLQQQLQGNLLTDSYSVQNYGEFPAHYASFGIQIDAPDGTQSTVPASATAEDHQLAPSENVPVTINVPSFGSEPGAYTVFAGFYSAGIKNDAGNYVLGSWCRILYPPASVTVVRGNIIPRPAAGSRVVSGSVMETPGA